MMLIRKLQNDDDLSDLISLSKLFFEEYAAHHSEFFSIDHLRDEDITGYFHKSIDTNDGATFIAIEGRRIIGYITVFVRNQPSFWAIKQIGVISGLMVHTDYRRRGIARALFTSAQNFIREQGVKYYTVYTATNNTDAIDLYESCGMTHLQTTLIGEC